LASLTTCNKIYDIFAPGEKIRPRVNVRTGNQTMSWLFDTGAAITCMNSRSLNATFGNQKPKKIANMQSCVAASGDTMNSIGIYEIDLYIKGQKFTHPVNVINELNDNIIGIDFMHRNKMVYDVNTRQVKFANEKMRHQTNHHSCNDLRHHYDKIQWGHAPRQNVHHHNTLPRSPNADRSTVTRHH
jgi:hypothetical protein